jgi:F-type H+-transporting ATPase subunit alpha
VSNLGSVRSAVDGILDIINLEKVYMGELLYVPGYNINAIVINITEVSVKAVILRGEELVKPGFTVGRTFQLFEFPVTSQLLGRVVNGYGEIIDGGNSNLLYNVQTRKVEIKAPGIISRYKVNEPLQTGIKSVDSLIPIGRGQRELIIGDKSTGKTTIGVDTILNQKNNN